MTCKKCGKEISDNSKFCGYCGQLVEKVDSLNSTNNQDVNDISMDNVIHDSEGTIIEEKGVNVEKLENGTQMNLENKQTSNSTVDVQENENLNTSNDSNIKTEFEPFMANVENTPQSAPTKKKNSNKVLLIIIAVLIVIAINLFAFMSMNKNKGTKNSISILEKAVGNFEKKGNESGTITAGVQIESSTSDVINLSASILYAKENDDYKFNIRLNKSAFTDAIDLYSVVNKEKASVYVNSKTIDMLGMTESNLNTWLLYTTELDNIVDEIKKSENKNVDVKLDNIIDKDHFKLVGKENDLNHYKLILDEKFFENIKNNITINEEDKKDLEEALETLKKSKIKSIEIDVYIDNSNEISKISIDLAKIINSEEIKKAELSIEFKDFNNTKVEIPKEAMGATMSIEDYINLYSIGNFNTDLDMDLDMNIDLDTDLNL